MKLEKSQRLHRQPTGYSISIMINQFQNKILAQWFHVFVCGVAYRREVGTTNSCDTVVPGKGNVRFLVSGPDFSLSPVMG